MLTIGRLASYAGVTIRAVRHYHQVGLLPEPERDASGYRTYDAAAVVRLIRIRTLAEAGVPTLVAFGEADDGWPTDLQAHMADRLGSRLAVIERAGHSPAVERPNETVATRTACWAAPAG